jgi:hypothetical protein
MPPSSEYGRTIRVTKAVPPLNWLIAMAAKNFTPDPTQPHLYSGMNYMAGVVITRLCIQAHLKAKIMEAKYPL